MAQARGSIDDERYSAWLSRMSELRSQLPKELVARAGELEPELHRFDAFDVLAYLSLLEFWTDPETYKEYEHPGLSAHVEYAAQLLLKTQYSDGEDEAYLGGAEIEHIQELIRDIFQMTRSLHLSEAVTQSRGESHNPADDLRDRTINQELHVRTPGYPCHLRKVLIDLFQPYGGWLIERAGFSAADAVQIAEGINSLVNRRVTERVQAGQEFSTALLSELAKFREMGEEHVKPDYREVVLRLAQRSDEAAAVEARSIASAWIVYGLGTTMSFTAEEIAVAESLPVERVRACLTAFSQEFGTERRDFHLPEPIHQLRIRPLLHHDGRFLSPCSGLFLWAIQPRLEEALQPKWQSYQKWRARYLESEAVRLLSTALQHAECLEGLHYTFEDGDGQQDYEVDGLVHFDDILFIVEGKAGTLSPSARRGGKERLRDKLKELIAEPYRQGRRAERFINSSDRPTFRDPSGKSVVISRQAIRHIFHVCVTLDTLGTFTTVLDQTAELGIFEDGPLPWVISLLDLAVICELVEFPSQLIHFLRRRLRLNELKLVDASDELDWFGCYLYSGLYFEKLEEFTDEPPDRIFLPSYTTEMDEWYMYQDGVRHTPAEKPRQVIPDRLRELISALEDDHQFGYSAAVCLLLDLDGDARERFVSMFGTVRILCQQDGRLHDFTLASSGGRTGVTCFAVTSELAEQEAAKLATFCELKKYQHRADTWLGLLTVVDQPGILHGCVIFDAAWKYEDHVDEIVRDWERRGFLQGAELPDK